MLAFQRRTRILTKLSIAALSIMAIASVGTLAQEGSSHGHKSQANVTAGSGTNAQFLQENDAAMIKMMDDMAAQPSGDVNRDFIEMMIPHHQGAIDMAVIYLRYGDNEQLQRLAQEIIIEQQQEIAAMRMALGDPLPASTPAPTQIEPASSTP